MDESKKTNIQQGLETYKIINLAGQNALRAGLLLNGGAAVALLAFIGVTIANPGFDKKLLLELTNSMMCFIVGALLFSIACGITYLAVYFDGNLKETKRVMVFHFFNITSNLLCLSSYGLFIWGAIKAYLAFRCFITNPAL